MLGLTEIYVSVVCVTVRYDQQQQGRTKPEAEIEVALDDAPPPPSTSRF